LDYCYCLVVDFVFSLVYYKSFIGDPE
jgi:hypothetical protein